MSRDDERYLFLIDVHLGVDVKQNDEELFPVSFNPCAYLNKLIMRLRFLLELKMI